MKQQKIYRILRVYIAERNQRLFFTSYTMLSCFFKHPKMEDVLLYDMLRQGQYNALMLFQESYH